MIETFEEPYIALNPAEDQVLGVFNNQVHVKKEHDKFVLVIPREEYLRAWNLYLDSKQSICHSYDEYCGVFGEIEAKVYHKQQQTIGINRWENGEETPENDLGLYMFTDQYDVYFVEKLGDYSDMEHG